MKPDLTITRYKADWKYIIQRYAGGSYTLQAIENLGEMINGVEPRRFVCLGVFPTEADADEAMKNLIYVNPAGTFDRALRFWTEFNEESDQHRGQPIISIETIRQLEMQEEAV